MNYIEYVMKFHPEWVVPMSPERRHSLTYEEPGPDLTDEERKAGYHWCPDWDGLMIGPGDKEVDACHCQQLVPIEKDEGDLMTFEEWKYDVEGKALIDYDGWGRLSTATHKDMRAADGVIPSLLPKLLRYKLPIWATHVLWYNR